MGSRQSVPEKTNLDDPQESDSSLFTHLPAAYFSPSTPTHILVQFQTHGGDLRPASKDGSVPLDVSLCFVTLEDSLIPHLSRRPAVLYDSNWVSECVRLGEKLPLDEWVVSRLADMRMKYITSDQTLGGRQHVGELPALTSTFTQYHGPTSATPHQSSNGSQTSRAQRIVAPRFLLDFDKNVTVSLGDDGRDLIATLASAPPFSKRNEVPPEKPIQVNSKRKNHDIHGKALKKSRKDQLRRESAPTSSRSSEGSRTQQHRYTKNQDRNLTFPTPLDSSEHGTPPEQTALSRPPRYMLKEVMELLTELNRVSEDVEVVVAEWLRMEQM